MTSQLTRHVAITIRELRPAGPGYLWRVRCPDCGDLGVTTHDPHSALQSAIEHYQAKLRASRRPAHD